ncbi:hypothetical protein [Zooshikella sp. RANM57]|uniref:hypothetical protein n=1 Tax=Zooshikella sp. RANM57 TaxID=3425863 RepID=UPI003D6EF972
MLVLIALFVNNHWHVVRRFFSYSEVVSWGDKTIQKIAALVLSENMREIQGFIVIVLCFLSFITYSDEGVIEEFKKAPIQKNEALTQSKALEKLAYGVSEIGYAVEAVESQYSFQIYSTNRNIIIEIMFANYKVEDGEPFYFMEDIYCPNSRGVTIMKEWPANSKSKLIEEQFINKNYNGRSICTAILGKNRNVLSWLHSFKLTEKKNPIKLNRLLDNLASKVFELKVKPYFIFKEIVIQ